MKWIFKCLVVLLLSLPSEAQIQPEISISEFLGIALTDPEIISKDSQIDFLSDKPYRLAPIRRMEFRTENDRLSAGEQEYRVRLSATNPWEAKNVGNLFKAKSQLLQLEQDIALKRALYLRYKLIVQYVFDREELELDIKKTEMLNRQLSTMTSMQGSSSFDINKYIKLKLQIIKKTITSMKVQQNADESGLILHDFLPDGSQANVSWTLDDLLPANRAYFITDSIRTKNLPSSKLMLNEQKLVINELKWKLEKSNINIGYIQAHYFTSRDSNPLGLALGVTIPIVNPNKADMTDRKLNIIASEYEVDKTKIEVNREAKKALDKVGMYYLQLIKFDQNISELDVGSFKQLLIVSSGSGPMDILELELEVISLSQTKLDIHRELMDAYFDYLYEKDALQIIPLTNYLSPGLSIISSIR